MTNRMKYDTIMTDNPWGLMTTLTDKYLPIPVWMKFMKVVYRMREGKMDDQDKADFKEMCEAASDKALIGLCEYELKNAKNAVLTEEKDLHYTLADIAFTEMERREIV